MRIIYARSALLEAC